MGRWGTQNCTFSRMEGVPRANVSNMETRSEAKNDQSRMGVRDGGGHTHAQLWDLGWLEGTRESQKILKQGSDPFGLGEVRNGLGSRGELQSKVSWL